MVTSDVHSQGKAAGQAAQPVDRVVRGYLLTAGVKFIEATYDRDQQQRIWTRMPAEARPLAAKASRGEWVPARYWSSTIEAIAQEHPDLEQRHDAIVAFGRFMAEEAVGSYLKLLLRVLSPSMFLRRLPATFEHDIRPGSVTVDTSQMAERRLITITQHNVEGLAYVWTVGAGWVAQALSFTGLKGVKGRTLSPALDQPFASEGTFKVWWE